MLTKNDRELLQTLTPAAAERWLRANGWESDNLGRFSQFKTLFQREHLLDFDSHKLETIARLHDRRPHEILLEMLHPGAVVETVVWFRFGEREPEVGQRVVLRDDTLTSFGGDDWQQTGRFRQTEPDDLWRPVEK